MSMPQVLTVHMIGNAHLDPAWLWRWPDGIQEAVATFRSALERLKETPEFLFTRGESWVFERIEEADPELFAEIVRYVQEGRIALVGGWVVQADCNLPGGEAYVRQALYGKAYFREKFGVEVKVAYSVDAFGHHASLPQILGKSGYELYIYTRPLAENSTGFPVEQSLPGTMFRWEAADGTGVLAFHIHCWKYGSYGIHLDDLGEHLRAAVQAAPPGLGHTLCFFGVGNHGGGPTRRQIAYIQEHAGEVPGARLVFSHPQRFLDAVRAEAGALPTVRRELNPTMTGCYSSCSEVKQLNRQVEQVLLASERWCALVAVVLRRMPYPADDLKLAWKQVLFNQFHDILAGSSIPQVYADARDSYGQARHLALLGLHQALRRVANAVDTRGEGFPFLVFNPSAWRRVEPVMVEPSLGARGADQGVLRNWSHDEFKVVDERGAEVDAQLVKGQDNTGGMAAWLFTAEVPPLGYRCYRIARQPAGRPLCRGAASLRADRTSLRNAFLEVELDPETGWLRRLYDVRRRVELLRAPANVPVVLRDEADSWGMWVRSYRDELARIRYTNIRLLESGPLRASLWLEGWHGRSRIATTMSLHRDRDLLSFSTRIEWFERQTMLKLAFPFALGEPRCRVEIPYGSVERRGDGEEGVAHSWTMLTGTPDAGGPGEYAVALLNDSKYAGDVLDAELRLTVLRCVPAAYMKGGCNLDEHPATPFLDYGVQEFNYWLKPDAEGPAALTRLAEAVNSPLLLTPESVHPGALPPTAAFLETTAGHTLVAVLKRTETDDGLCLRLVEAEGRPEEFRLVLRDGTGRESEIAVAMRPWEIKTLVLRGDLVGLPVVTETDLLERPVAKGPFPSQ